MKKNENNWFIWRHWVYTFQSLPLPGVFGGSRWQKVQIVLCSALPGEAYGCSALPEIVGESLYESGQSSTRPTWPVDLSHEAPGAAFTNNLSDFQVSVFIDLHLGREGRGALGVNPIKHVCLRVGRFGLALLAMPYHTMHKWGRKCHLDGRVCHWCRSPEGVTSSAQAADVIGLGRAWAVHLLFKWIITQT